MWWRSVPGRRSDRRDEGRTEEWEHRPQPRRSPVSEPSGRPENSELAWQRHARRPGLVGGAGDDRLDRLRPSASQVTNMARASRAEFGSCGLDPDLDRAFELARGYDSMRVPGSRLAASSSRRVAAPRRKLPARQRCPRGTRSMAVARSGGLAGHRLGIACPSGRASGRAEQVEDALSHAFESVLSAVRLFVDLVPAITRTLTRNISRRRGCGPARARTFLPSRVSCWPRIGRARQGLGFEPVDHLAH